MENSKNKTLNQHAVDKELKNSWKDSGSSSKNVNDATIESNTDEKLDDAGYMNDANSSVDRDTGSSNKQGWNVETSKTSRHK